MAEQLRVKSRRVIDGGQTSFLIVDQDDQVERFGLDEQPELPIIVTELDAQQLNVEPGLVYPVPGETIFRLVSRQSSRRNTIEDPATTATREDINQRTYQNGY